MKRRLVSVLVLVVVVATFGFASNGDTINIGGYVTLKLDLTVAPDPGAVNLTLEGTTVDFNPLIAQITISTNNTAGWELWVFAANAAGGGTALTNADGDPIPYTITYAGTGGVGPVAIPDTGVMVGENTAADGDALQELSVTYTQQEDFPAGYYSDQLAIVLRAK